MKHKILIIGGMGPQASLELHTRIINKAAALGAKNGEDYPVIVHLSLPVRDFISDTKRIVAATKLVNKYLGHLASIQFTDVIIACNTAHLLIDDISVVLGKQPISLPHLIQKHVNSLGFKQVGLLASPTTIKSGLYNKYIPSIVILDHDEQEKTETIIRSVIANKHSSSKQLIDQIKKLHLTVDQVVLGCTELSTLYRCQTPLIKGVIDPLELAVNQLFSNKTKV